MPRIFISYRNADENFAALLLDDHLCQRFGRDHIFRASRSIRLGDDFPPTIWDSLHRCTALLAVIGAGWDGAGPDGRRRIDDPADYVRREIAEALRCGLRVIPILVAGATMPTAAELPDELAPLAERQYLRLYARDSRYEIQRLLDELAELLGVAGDGPADPAQPAAPPPRPAATEQGADFGGATITVGGHFAGRDLHVSGPVGDVEQRGARR